MFNVIRGQAVLLYFQSFTRRFDRAEYAPRIAINQINAGDRRIPSYNRVYCFQNFKTVVKGKQLMEFLDFTLNTLIVFNAMDNEFDRHINMIMRSVYLFLYLIFFLFVWYMTSFTECKYQTSPFLTAT